MQDRAEQEPDDLCRQMALVRSRGLANAAVLSEQVDKLSDWREHVKAHPIPIALAVSAVAYWAIPTKRSPPRERNETTPKEPRATGASAVGSGAFFDASDSANEREAKVAGLSGLSGAAMGFLGSLIGNAVRSYVNDQIQTLITSRGNHAASQQRQTPFSRV